MSLSVFIILNNELLNNDPDVVSEQAPLIILYIKSDMCMDRNGKNTKHTRQISRRANFVRSYKEYNIHSTL